MPRLSCLALGLSVSVFSLAAVAQQNPVPTPAQAYPVTGASQTTSPAPAKKDNDAPLPASAVHDPTLWHDPGAIETLDLYGGPGGTKGMPTGPFTFLDEERDGTNPKFDVRDSNGKKWRVKLGEEVRPEVVASRLLWAVGYYSNIDYVLQYTSIPGVKLSRGDEDAKKGHFREARFSRKPSGQDKIAIWAWKSNPFSGTREFNGLRVMMAVMNNWDLKDENNSVYSDKATGHQIFLVNDVGATFGTNGISWSKARSKGNIDSFRGSKFITRTGEKDVDFGTPKQPNFAVGAVNPKQYAMRINLDWIGNNIPRDDARWMGKLLGRLSHKQLVDAFRAGHFPANQIDAYVEIVESRIKELQAL